MSCFEGFIGHTTQSPTCRGQRRPAATSLGASAPLDHVFLDDFPRETIGVPCKHVHILG